MTYTEAEFIFPVRHFQVLHFQRPSPDCTVNHLLIRTEQLDVLAQLFHVLNLFPVNSVLQSGRK